MKRTLLAVFGGGALLAGCAATQKDDGKESETEQAVTSTTQTTPIPFQLASPVFGIGGFQLGGSVSNDTSSFPISIQLTGQARWIATANTTLTWDADKVRQGQTLDINRALGAVTGTMKVLWSMSVSVDVPLLGTKTFGPIPLSLGSVTCVPKFDPLPDGTSGTIAGTIAGNAGDVGGLNAGGQNLNGSPCGGVAGATSNAALACNGITGDVGDTSDPTYVAPAGNQALSQQTNNFGTSTGQVQPVMSPTGPGTVGDGIDGTDLSATRNQLGSLEGQLVNQAAQIDSSRPHYSCSANGGVTLFEINIPAGPYAKLNMNATFDIVPQKGTATSQFMIGTSQAATANLDISPSPADDTLAMPCSYPANSDVQYVIQNFAWRPSSMLVTQQISLDVGLMDPVIGAVETPAFFSEPVTPQLKEALAVELDAPSSTTDLGPLQANNVLPTVTAGPFSGTEGLPVALSETASSACPITSYAWTFSNGNSAFGASPSVLFGPHGSYSGQLVVTDSTHLSQTADFGVSIANAPPVATAGPATSGAWGMPIALVGQASDPGGDALTYSWNFGDGTIGVGGTTASHAYAVPGVYTAVFTACDDLMACVNASTQVTVRARTTSVAFTGTNTGVFSAQAPLSGAIVDEFGKPVVGGTLAFTLAGAAAGSAQTDSTGNATTTQTIGLPAGSYPTTATFVGSQYYVGGATTGSFSVTRMASAVGYTGAVTGNANHTVTLSAKLVDALNRPLAGKPVVFKLGTQSVSATSDANGIASTPLALTQKNGSYPLSATWTPAGTDATEWTGASVAGTFTIGNK